MWWTSRVRLRAIHMYQCHPLLIPYINQIGREVYLIPGPVLSTVSNPVWNIAILRMAVAADLMSSHWNASWFYTVLYFLESLSQIKLHSRHTAGGHPGTPHLDHASSGWNAVGPCQNRLGVYAVLLVEWRQHHGTAANIQMYSGCYELAGFYVARGLGCRVASAPNVVFLAGTCQCLNMLVGG